MTMIFKNSTATLSTKKVYSKLRNMLEKTQNKSLSHRYKYKIIISLVLSEHFQQLDSWLWRFKSCAGVI